MSLYNYGQDLEDGLDCSFVCVFGGIKVHFTGLSELGLPIHCVVVDATAIECAIVWVSCALLFA